MSRENQNEDDEDLRAEDENQMEEERQHQVQLARGQEPDDEDEPMPEDDDDDVQIIAVHRNPPNFVPFNPFRPFQLNNENRIRAIFGGPDVRMERIDYEEDESSDESSGIGTDYDDEEADDENEDVDLEELERRYIHRLRIAQEEERREQNGNQE